MTISCGTRQEVGVFGVEGGVAVVAVNFDRWSRQLKVGRDCLVDIVGHEIRTEF